MKKILAGNFIVFLLSVNIFSQELTATYQTLSPNIFASYKKPIEIAILKFEGSNDLHNKLYDELKKQPGIHEKFTIFPYEVLEHQKKVLGIKGEIAPYNLNALKLLRDNLDIELVVSGNFIGSSKFILNIYSSIKGEKLFEGKYENSLNSTALKDAVELFSGNKSTTYEENKLKCPKTITDTRDGKIYETVLIGTQCWMKENLNYKTNTGSWCYHDKESNCEKYGRLYNWETAKRVCPSGWYLPSRAEFEKLDEFVNNDGNSLKAVGQGSSGGAGTNTSSFSVLLAGYRGSDGSFGNLGSYAYFWSSTEYDAADAYYMGLYGSNSGISFYGYSKENGFSVRCLKD